MFFQYFVWFSLTFPWLFQSVQNSLTFHWLENAFPFFPVWVGTLTKHFHIAVNDFDVNKSARYSWVLIVTELVVNGTQCILLKKKTKRERRVRQVTYSSWLFTSWGNKYMCLKLSMASTGRSLLDFPRWYSGCENFKPSAVKKLTPAAKQNDSNL